MNKMQEKIKMEGIIIADSRNKKIEEERLDAESADKIRASPRSLSLSLR